MVDCLLAYIYLQLCDILNELLIFYQNGELYLIIRDCCTRKTENYFPVVSSKLNPNYNFCDESKLILYRINRTITILVFFKRFN